MSTITPKGWRLLTEHETATLKDFCIRSHVGSQIIDYWEEVDGLSGRKTMPYDNHGYHIIRLMNSDELAKNKEEKVWLNPWD